MSAPGARLYPLDSPIQPYAWGSRTFLAELRGDPAPAAGPEAELWMGAHHRAPSRSGDRSLADLVAADPVGLLGGEVAAAFDGRLPFLLKVLAAERPLSLQAHPSAAQAKAGFAAEEAGGVPLDADERNYRDDWPKPELICALTPFEGLCGFRPLPATLDLLDGLVADGAAGLRAPAERLRGSGDLAATVRDLLTLPATEAKELVAAVAAAASAAGAATAGHAAERACAVRLGTAYPGDPGVVVALLLNLVRLAPGEAMYLPAGNLHAYLRGAGVEILASSDNVLRGGLTPKHVDVPELLDVLDATPREVEVLRAEWPEATDDRHAVGEDVYETPSPYFRLSVLHQGVAVRLPSDAPQILLCTSGAARVRAGDEDAELLSGGAVFVRAGSGPVDVHPHDHRPEQDQDARTRIFRATVPSAGR